jgi:hypothetical protein
MMIAKGSRICATVFSGLICVGGALADISGSPLQNYGNLDTCVGCLFPAIQFGVQDAGQTVLSYAFYDGQTLASTNYITPILFEESSGNVFTVIGIGASATGFTPNGINPEQFTLLAGSATVEDTNTFFGYLDGRLTYAGGGIYTVTGNAGTISTTYPGNGGPSQYFIGEVASLGVNTALTGNTFGSQGQSSRTYALQVTTPEPSFYGLLGLELSGLVIVTVVSRRRKRRLV